MHIQAIPSFKFKTLNKGTILIRKLSTINLQASHKFLQNYTCMHRVPEYQRNDRNLENPLDVEHHCQWAIPQPSVCTIFVWNLVVSQGAVAFGEAVALQSRQTAAHWGTFRAPSGTCSGGSEMVQQTSWIVRGQLILFYWSSVDLWFVSRSLVKTKVKHGLKFPNVSPCHS